MITQVIDKDGKVYTVEYPLNPKVWLYDAEKGHAVKTIYLDQLAGAGYRPYMIDGELAREHIEAWEAYAHYPNAKEKWMAVEDILRENGFEVSNNGQDMLIKMNDFEDRIPCEVVMNHTPTEVLMVEKDNLRRFDRLYGGY